MITTRVTINGHTYESPDAMPPDVRRAYDEAMQRLGPSLADRSGLRIEREGSTISFNVSLSGHAAPREGSAPATPRPIEPGGIANLRKFVLTVVGAIVFGLAAWFLLGRP